jgi:hypothetical protein
MNENEGQKAAHTNEPTAGNEAEAVKGPTEKLRDEEKSESGTLVPGDAGVPGAQKPDNENIKDEKGLNTE